MTELRRLTSLPTGGSSQPMATHPSQTGPLVSAPFWAFGLAGVLGAGLGSLPQGLAPEARAQANQLQQQQQTSQQQTWFTRPPSSVTFTNYYWYVMLASQYYFTVTLPTDAGAGLGGLVIQQTRGVDRNFQFFPNQTTAFLGTPRREGTSFPVQAQFDNASRTMTVTFPQPPQPGQTITLSLVPQNNPRWADTYMFAVQALPAGPNPVPASLGYATMGIYNTRGY
jgi:hypothetical protein